MSSVVPDRRTTPSARLAVSAIDRLPCVGVLADLAGQVEALQRELDRGRPLAVVARADAVAHLVVEVGLPEHRQAGEELAGADAGPGAHHRAALDGVDQQ